MIKLWDAELTSILPYFLKSDPDTQAISYAYKKAMQKMIQFARLSTLYGNIDNLREDILDVLAIELQSQYYEKNLPINMKKNIIKGTLAWYQKSGTVGAVQEMIQTVFGEGSIIEWDRYPEGNGEPGTFDITTDTIVTDNLEEKLAWSIKYVKKASASLRHVRVRKIHQANLFTGFAKFDRVKIVAEPEKANIKIVKEIDIKQGVVTRQHIKASYNPEGRN